MTTPTAVVIFRWACLSSASRQPILENRSEPDQHSSATMDSQNQVIFLVSFLFLQFYQVRVDHFLEAHENAQLGMEPGQTSLEIHGIGRADGAVGG